MIQNAETVAGIGVSQFTGAVSVPWSPNALRLGRYLCWAFYRDQGELLQVFPELQEVFESAIVAYPAWGELLAGAFRPRTRMNKLMLGSARLRNGKGLDTPYKAGSSVISKYRELGQLVDNIPGSYWFNKKSIDGLPGLRAYELLLYGYVVKRALELWLSK